MDQGDIALFVVVHELLLPNPLQQLRAIGCFKDLAQSVGFLQAFDVLPDGQQVQVMVTKYADQRLADAIEETQGFQRLWATIDQIAHQPQTIFCRVESDLF